ncbi:rhomboid-like protein [Streptomyces sp. NPDC101151]|uniref:rhomboid-like protein n=1 Tax=Streptomyces sp. NPDC101151 TaxID=3366115 RepID=UPI003811273F
MERTVTGPATAASPPLGTPLPVDPLPDVAGLLDGVPRQRELPAPMAAPAPTAAPAPSKAPARSKALAPSRAPAAARPSFRPWHFLPTPTGTPFTFAYAVVLAVTSLVAARTDPAVMHALYQGSSTDVAHLVRTPVLVLLTSALWIAGGIVSPYAAAFVLVLTGLERRIGGARAACVFLTGHVLATLATEVPVGLAVLFGHLPDTSLHRLDYGISFGVAASIGSLAGLLRPWVRWPLLTLVAGKLVNDLIAFRDPMTNWGHLIALTLGIASWPLVRRRQRSPVSV